LSSDVYTLHTQNAYAVYREHLNDFPTICDFQTYTQDNSLHFQLAGNDAQGHICWPFHVIRSSAKGGGSDLARVALRVYFVSLGSIQH
jgi:hypothetical protein